METNQHVSRIVYDLLISAVGSLFVAILIKVRASSVLNPMDEATSFASTHS